MASPHAVALPSPAPAANPPQSEAVKHATLIQSRPVTVAFNQPYADQYREANAAAKEELKRYFSAVVNTTIFDENSQLARIRPRVEFGNFTSGTDPVRDLVQLIGAWQEMESHDITRHDRQNMVDNRVVAPQ